MQQLSDDAKVWVFGISPALDEKQSALVLQHVDAFLAGWAAHGTPIRSARELRDGSFLIVAADETSETSGCSIDRLFGTLKSLEQQFGVAILDSNRIFFRENGNVRAVPRASFRDAATPDSIVFDVTAERLAQVRGAFERRAADSWHRQLF
jgi:hypothetical protein